MASNFFGQIFRITTFGESHGLAIGVVIDGCPAGLPLNVEEINLALSFRRPGRNELTSPRKEKDEAQILSGIFEGKTTGAPIAITIPNIDADSSQYAAIKELYRPGHANFTYLHKYGVFDHRGGGRSSARETAARVAAGAVAKKLLAHFHIECVAFVAQIGEIQAPTPEFIHLRKKTYDSPVFCPDVPTSHKMIEVINLVKEEGDSIGGVIGCMATIPIGLGDPVYAKLESTLAAAMLSIPASKGFEIGSGFASAKMKGSEHNDPFEMRDGQVQTTTNLSGGTLGGISTGSPLFFRVAFKPTSSIRLEQKTVNLNGEIASFQLPADARHDPCVAVRAVPVVEAMCALVLADALLLHRSSIL